jgi:hypothetical protein
MTITELLRNFHSWTNHTLQLKDGKFVLKSGYFERCIALAIMWFEENFPDGHPLKRRFYRLLKNARPNNIVGFYSLMGLLQAIQEVLDPEEAKKQMQEYQRKKQKKQQDDALIEEIEQTMQNIDAMLKDDEGGNQDGKIIE